STVVISHEKDSSAINSNQPWQWASSLRASMRDKRISGRCGLIRIRLYLYIQAYAIKRPTWQLGVQEKLRTRLEIA
ncbi:MAG: hypothetical protein RR740_23365, partial [Pseudomonas sp.]